MSRSDYLDEIMPPEGTLTPAQFEIMELIWASAEGLTIGQVWEGVFSRRSVSRTTVLNLVGRLEKRKWLKRRKEQGVYRYLAAVARPAAKEQLAVGFLEDFFEGSAGNLLMSLLGSKRVSKSEIQALKRLLEEDSAPSNRSRS